MPFFRMYDLNGEFIYFGLNASYLPLILLIFWFVMNNNNKKYKDKNKKLTKIAEEYKKQRDKYRDDLVQEKSDCLMLMNRMMKLEMHELKNKKEQFTHSEIDTLIRLCHPDKHDGKDSAKEITQKLLAMRGDKG